MSDWLRNLIDRFRNAVRIHCERRARAELRKILMPPPRKDSRDSIGTFRRESGR